MRNNSFQDVAKQHQLKIARSTMKMLCIFAKITGGMNHILAAELLGQKVPEDCDCERERVA